jgi:hypothetical protein
MTRLTPVFLLLGLLLGGRTLHAQGLDSILGNWVGISEDVQGDRVQITKTMLVMTEGRYPLRELKPGVLLVGPPDDQARLTYSLQGDVLTVTFFEETSKWRRVGALPKPGPKPGPKPVEKPMGDQPGSNPLGDTGQNPLGAPPPKPVDPFARKFAGDGIQLKLEGERAKGYRGELEFQGRVFPVQAKATANKLSGSFRVGKNDFGFEAQLTGDKLTLTSGGKTYRMMGEKLKPAEPVNPLGGGGKQAPGVGVVVGGIGTTPKRQGPPPGMIVFVEPKLELAAYLPQNWSKMQQQGVAVTFNPGIPQGQTLDAVVSLIRMPVPAEQQQLAADKLLNDELADFRQGLQSEGITTQAPQAPARAFEVRGLPAASITLPASMQSGATGVVWLAMSRQGKDCFICMAILVNNSEAKYRKVLDQVFASLRPAAESGQMGGR